MCHGSIILSTGSGAWGHDPPQWVGDVIAHYATRMFVLCAIGLGCCICSRAQGSATVAMITGAGLMASIIGDGAHFLAGLSFGNWIGSLPCPG